MNDSSMEELRKQHEQGVHKLATGLLEQYEPTFKTLQSQINELVIKQEQLIDQIEVENDRLKRLENEDLQDMFVTVKDYYTRLHNAKKEMAVLQDRSAKLKKRGLKLLHQKQNEALEREHQREAQLAKEQDLIAKPNKT